MWLLLHHFVSDIIPEFGYEHGREALVPMKKNYYVSIEFMINSYTSTSSSTGQIFKLQSKPSANQGIDCCSIGSRLPLLFARNNYKGRFTLLAVLWLHKIIFYQKSEEKVTFLSSLTFIISVQTLACTLPPTLMVTGDATTPLLRGCGTSWRWSRVCMEATR